jgi:TonB family protein
MKCHAAKCAVLFFVACLVATSAGAKEAKLDSIDALAQALAAKLPRQPGAAVYVAFPRWKGKQAHYQLREEIGSELARALVAAEPGEKVITPTEAADIMAKTGYTRSDVYIAMASRPTADYLADMMGATALITWEVKLEKDGLLLTVEATEPGRKEKFAEFKALLPLTPKLSARLAQPDVPFDDGAGVYAAGIGGVGYPACVHCPNPPYPAQAAAARSSGTVWAGFTVGTDGKVSDVVFLANPQAPGRGQSSLATIRSWQFRPAQGPDGKSVPVRIIAVLRFRIR